MSNPYFSSNPAFAEKSKLDRTPAGYPGMAGYTPGQTGTAQHTGYAHPGYPQQGQNAPADHAMSPERLEDAYRAPAAGPLDTGRMTYDDAIMKTAIVVGTIVVTAAVHWLVLGPNMGLTMLGLVAGLVLGLVNAFKKEPSPLLIMGYAVAEGLFLGGISAMFESQWGGIVLQAVLATSVTFLVCLGLYTSGKVRVTAKSTRIMLIAMLEDCETTATPCPPAGNRWPPCSSGQIATPST